MKIAILGTVFPFRGGLAVYNERLATQLINEGHEVIIYTFKLQYPGILFPGKSQYSEDPRPGRLNIIQSVNSINPFNWLIVGKQIKNKNFDIILVKYWLPFMGPCFGTILRLAKSKTTKVISILDNIIPHEKRPGDWQFTKYFVSPVDGFVAMSKNVYNDLAKFDKNKPRALSPHPLFDNFGQKISKHEAQKFLGLDSSKKYILFFGLIRDYKGLDILLEAMADERIGNGNIVAIVAGEFYSDKDKYLKIIEDLHLKNRIALFDKFIPNGEVKYFFGASDLVVQPYKSATQSGVTQIAYHFEKPMIVTKVGGLEEMCPNNKVGYVTDVDPKAISDAILKYFEDDKETTFVENVIEEKKKYGWDRLVGTILKVYEEIQNK